MKKKKRLGGIIAAFAVVAAAIAGITYINSDAKAAGNQLDTHPSTAQLFINNKQLCSGVYVAPQVVLTADHCISSARTIHVVNDHLVDAYDRGQLNSTTKGQVIWRAPNGMDLALVRTPGRTSSYARIAATRPDIGMGGQICGTNRVDDPYTGKTTAWAKDNYCGTIQVRDVSNYSYGSKNYGEFVFVAPSWGWPNDSGGPLYDAEGRVHGVLSVGWEGGYGNHWDENGFTATYPYINELRANGAMIDDGSAPAPEPEPTYQPQPQPTYQPQPEPTQDAAAISDGTYVITSALSNSLALDVNAESRRDGANVQVWKANNGPAQRFRVTNLGGNQYSIVNVNSNKSLDIKGASQSAGANVLQWTWGNTINQKFYITPAAQGGYTIRAAHSNQVLDVSGGKATSGANVVQWPDSGGAANQRWNFNRL